MINILKFFTGKTEKAVNRMIKKREKELNESLTGDRGSVKTTGGLKLTGRDKKGKVLFVKKQKTLITKTE